MQSNATIPKMKYKVSIHLDKYAVDVTDAVVLRCQLAAAPGTTASLNTNAGHMEPDKTSALKLDLQHCYPVSDMLLSVLARKDTDFFLVCTWKYSLDKPGNCLNLTTPCPQTGMLWTLEAEMEDHDEKPWQTLLSQQKRATQVYDLENDMNAVLRNSEQRQQALQIFFRNSLNKICNNENAVTLNSEMVFKTPIQTLGVGFLQNSALGKNTDSMVLQALNEKTSKAKASEIFVQSIEVFPQLLASIVEKYGTALDRVTEFLTDAVNNKKTQIIDFVQGQIMQLLNDKDTETRKYVSDKRVVGVTLCGNAMHLDIDDNGEAHALVDGERLHSCEMLSRQEKLNNALQVTFCQNGVTREAVENIKSLDQTQADCEDGTYSALSKLKAVLTIVRGDKKHLNELLTTNIPSNYPHLESIKCVCDVLALPASADTSACYVMAKANNVTNNMKNDMSRQNTNNNVDISTIDEHFNYFVSMANSGQLNGHCCLCSMSTEPQIQQPILCSDGTSAGTIEAGFVKFHRLYETTACTNIDMDCVLRSGHFQVHSPNANLDQKIASLNKKYCTSIDAVNIVSSIKQSMIAQHNMFLKCDVIAYVDPKHSSSFYSTLIECQGARFATCEKLLFDTSKNSMHVTKAFPAIHLPTHLAEKNKNLATLYYKTKIPDHIDVILDRIAKHLCLFYQRPPKPSPEIQTPEYFLTKKYYINNNAEMCAEVCSKPKKSNLPNTAIYISDRDNRYDLLQNLRLGVGIQEADTNGAQHASAIQSCLDTSKQNQCFVRKTCNGSVVQWDDFCAN